MINTNKKKLNLLSKYWHFKNLLLPFLFFVFISSQAQQGLQMELTATDSSQMRLQRLIQYQQFISGTFNSEFMDEVIELPVFNFDDELRKRWSLNLNINPVNNFAFGSLSSGDFNSFFSPFFYNGTVLSSAAYQMGDKFTVGGFSYGANSIFSAPFPAGDLNNFDTHGSTLFMQYKVSKKFKIETRINVNQRRVPGF